MRKLIVLPYLAILACTALPGQSVPIGATFGAGVPAASLISHTAAGSTGANTVTTSAIDTTGATLIVIEVAADVGAGCTSTLSDSKSNSYTRLHTQGGISFPNNGGLYYVVSPTVGSGHTFTYGCASGGSAPSIAVVAFSGATTFDTQNWGHGSTTSTTTVQPGSVTASVSNELAITGYAATSSVSSIDSSFTITDSVGFLGGNHYAVAIAWRTVTGSINPTWTAGSNCDLGASIATFAP